MDVLKYAAIPFQESSLARTDSAIGVNPPLLRIVNHNCEMHSTAPTYAASDKARQSGTAVICA
jgi:hypothetical protein